MIYSTLYQHKFTIVLQVLVLENGGGGRSPVNHKSKHTGSQQKVKDFGVLPIVYQFLEFVSCRNLKKSAQMFFIGPLFTAIRNRTFYDYDLFSKNSSMCYKCNLTLTQSPPLKFAHMTYIDKQMDMHNAKITKAYEWFISLNVDKVRMNRQTHGQKTGKWRIWAHHEVAQVGSKSNKGDIFN